MLNIIIGVQGEKFELLVHLQGHSLAHHEHHQHVLLQLLAQPILFSLVHVSSLCFGGKQKP